MSGSFEYAIPLIEDSTDASTDEPAAGLKSPFSPDPSLDAADSVDCDGSPDDESAVSAFGA